MKRIFIFSILLIAASFLLISCGTMTAVDNKPINNDNKAATNSPASGGSADADVKKLVSDLAAALSKNDVAALDKIYADNYMLVTPTNDEIFTKAERLDAMKSGELSFENVVFSDVKVRVSGDTAVAIADSKGRSTNKGKASDTNYAVTFFANKSKDGWRLVGARLSLLVEVGKKDDAAKKDESNINTNTNTNTKKY